MTQEGPGQPVDPYQVLGVDARAARGDIVRAYRQLARASHPDARPGDAAAEARFRMVTLAYQVLADPARRAAYDQAHPGAGRSGGRRPAGGRQTAAGQGTAGGQQAAAGQHTAGGQQAAAGQPVPVRRLTSTYPAGSAGHPGGPPLWAGPVVVEPPGGQAAAGGYRDPAPGPDDGSGEAWPGRWSWWA